MRELLILVIVGTVMVFGVKSCADSEWFQALERERTARELAEKTPHVVREADGCKVYSFKTYDGRDHYFTRCQDSTTTTESSYSVGCGKGCSRTETESITAR